MNASRRTYAIAIGAVTLVLAGSMVGAAAYAANDGTSGNWDNSWSQGPGNGMMGGGWGGDGGMMGRGWSQGTSTDTPAVAPDQAATLAKDWAATNLPDATLDSGLQMPMGYLFVAREDGKVVAHVLVNGDTGRVWAVDSASFGGMMGRGWENGIGGTGGGAMMGQGRLAGSSMMNGRGF
jgi:hypothetical protein